MDTRSKILTAEAAESLPVPLVLVTGYFDFLRAETIRELQQVRQRTPGYRVLVAVVTDPGSVLDSAARAELVAALRMVDYVVTTNHDHVDAFVERLRPAELVRLETGDLRRRRRLIEDVQRSQKR